MSECKKMRLDEAIHQHVVKLPDYLQAEVYDFVLFLEQKQKKVKPSLNSEVIELTIEQQGNFVQALLNPKSVNTKLQQSAQNYQYKINE